MRELLVVNAYNIMAFLTLSHTLLLCIKKDSSWQLMSRFLGHLTVALGELMQDPDLKEYMHSDPDLKAHYETLKMFGVINEEKS